MSGLPKGNFPSVQLRRRGLSLGVEVVVDDGLWFLWVPAQEAFGIADQPTPIRLDPEEITQGSFVFILFLAGLADVSPLVFLEENPSNFVLSGFVLMCWR